ncbi:MAG: hypothetical protein ABI742_02640 [Gemmatimonadota bacterium]
MTPRNLLLLLTLALVARPLGAQQVIKRPVFDSVQTAVRKSLYALRDSLQLVDAASARLVRDRQRASDALLRARARSIAGRCTVAARMAVESREVVVRAGRPAPDKRGALPRLDRALVELKDQLERCSAEFQALTAPEKFAELRDYGIGRGAKVQEAIRRYEPSVRLYFDQAVGDRYLPNLAGAGATPSRE